MAEHPHEIQAPPAGAGRRPWHRPMRARGGEEPHRAATPLELFFDLCFVVAVARAAERLHHGLSEDHIGPAVVGYLSVFFAIWWAWMNFTWFASAYDTDDDVYRLTTLVQIAGALVLAAGVKRAFDGDFTIITWGYVVMRLALVGQWLRAARSDPPGRKTALRFAVGVSLVQAGWLVRLALPADWQQPAFFVLVAADMLVPAWAERARRTPWHPGHIAERYGLFTIIMLGESVLAATIALEAAVRAGHGGVRLIALAVAGIVIVFSMWWLYFDRSPHDLLTSLRATLAWGYGHYLIFASAAGVGAGLAVSVDHDTHVAHLPALAAGYTTAVPVAVYLAAVWVLHVRPRHRGTASVAFPVTAALVLGAPLTPAPVHLIAVLLAALVMLTGLATRTPARTGRS